MSTGGTFSPPAVMMSSLMRPVICMKPLQQQTSSKQTHTNTTHSNSERHGERGARQAQPPADPSRLACNTHKSDRADERTRLEPAFLNSQNHGKRSIQPPARFSSFAFISLSLSRNLSTTISLNQCKKKNEQEKIKLLCWLVNDMICTWVLPP